MYEDRPLKDTPLFIQRDLAAYGGLNPFGDPIWRLVLAQNRRIHCFGQLPTFHEGFDADKVSDDPQEKARIAPVRVELGEFWLPLYSFDGWVLERWFPASTWGKPQAWDELKAQDGRTRLLAAYPSRGDYKMMPGCGPWKSIVEAGDVKAAIRTYNLLQRRNPTNWANHIQSEMAWEKFDRQQKADTHAEEISAKYREAMGGILQTVSQSAQEFRNHLAGHTAGGTNLGASEKWGA